jgi:hypothetical protein
MSKLATQLQAVTDIPSRAKRGPNNACFPRYGAGDLDDWNEIERLRNEGFEWRDVQRTVDEKLGITEPIAPDKFRYHWRRKCYCWPQDLRL